MAISEDIRKIIVDEKLRKIVDEKLRIIAAYKEEYVEAWIAETGLLPSECIIVEKSDDPLITKMWLEPKTHRDDDLNLTRRAENNGLRDTIARLTKENLELTLENTKLKLEALKK